MSVSCLAFAIVSLVGGTSIGWDAVSTQARASSLRCEWNHECTWVRPGPVGLDTVEPPHIWMGSSLEGLRPAAARCTSVKGAQGGSTYPKVLGGTVPLSMFRLARGLTPL